MPEPNQASKYTQPRPTLGPSSVPKVGSDYIPSTGGGLVLWFDLIVELGQIGGKKFRVLIRMTKTNVLIVCTRINSTMIFKGPGHYQLIAYWRAVDKNLRVRFCQVGEGKGSWNSGMERSVSVRGEQIRVCAAVSKTPDRNNQEGGGLCGSEFRNIPVRHDGRQGGVHRFRSRWQGLLVPWNIRKQRSLDQTGPSSTTWTHWPIFPSQTLLPKGSRAFKNSTGRRLRAKTWLEP